MMTSCSTSTVLTSENSTPTPSSSNSTDFASLWAGFQLEQSDLGFLLEEGLGVGKGKGKHIQGSLSTDDEELAFEMYRDELGRQEVVLRDGAFARGFAVPPSNPTAEQENGGIRSNPFNPQNTLPPIKTSDDLERQTYHLQSIQTILNSERDDIDGALSRTKGKGRESGPLHSNNGNDEELAFRLYQQEIEQEELRLRDFAFVRGLEAAIELGGAAGEEEERARRDRELARRVQQAENGAIDGEPNVVDLQNILDTPCAPSPVSKVSELALPAIHQTPSVPPLPSYPKSTLTVNRMETDPPPSFLSGTQENFRAEGSASQTTKSHPLPSTEGDESFASELQQRESDLEAFRMRDFAYAKRVAEELNQENDNGERSPVASSSNVTLNASGVRALEECIACRERSVKQLMIGVPCGHFWDSTCLVQLFMAATRDESLMPPKCCGKGIPVNNVEQYLTTSDLNTFMSKQKEFTASNRVYCVNERCSRFLGPATETPSTLDCPACWRKVCSACKGTAHPLGDCKPDDADQTLHAAVKREGWAKCPTCMRFVELESGCFHMTCLCKTQFCYVCQKKWKTCNCRTWDDHRLGPGL